MKSDLKKIPAFGITIWDQVEDSIGDDVSSFRDWLTDKYIVFRDDRCFYFDILIEHGYTIVEIEDLNFWIEEWNGTDKNNLKV